MAKSLSLKKPGFMKNPAHIIHLNTSINAGRENVWEYFTKPEHIVQWNNASPDWHTLRAVNDVQPGGKFIFRMQAKDNSFGFDFSGTYNDVVLHKYISYTLDDGRRVTINFFAADAHTEIDQTFELENENPADLQRQGWQAILDNFKKYAETISSSL